MGEHDEGGTTTAILGTWNPLLARWSGLGGLIDATAKGLTVSSTWAVNNRKHGLGPGDRFYLLKVGKSPCGLVGSGTITSHPYPAPHWNGTPGRTTQLVDLEFDRVIEPGDLLPRSILGELLPHTNWKPMSSGTTINPADEAQLGSLWEMHVAQL